MRKTFVFLSNTKVVSFGCFHDLKKKVIFWYSITYSDSKSHFQERPGPEIRLNESH